jgi:hypothetical protein
MSYSTAYDDGYWAFGSYYDDYGNTLGNWTMYGDSVFLS